MLDTTSSSARSGETPHAATVLVTGASTGFGRRTSEQLARRGHTVIATMRDPDGRNRPHAAALRAFADAEGLALHVLALDVTDEGSITDAVAATLARVGHLDVLVNNAGIWGPGVLEAFTMEQWARFLDVNLLGSVRAIRAVLPHMRARGTGLVVQVSSLQGRFILPYSGPYVATKWAVEGMAETFRYELAPTGVEVAIVEPYDYLTEMKEKAAGHAAQDAAVEAQYGDAVAFIRRAYLVPDTARARDPQEVVDAITALVEMPAGTRPLRTPVGNPIPQITEINATADAMHAGLFPYIGLGHLLAPTVPPAPTAVAAP